MLQRICQITKISTLLLFTIWGVACQQADQNQIGYIEADYVYVSSSITGTLQKLLVVPGQEVTVGEILYRLDPEPEASSVQASLANNRNLTAQREFYKTQLERQKYLYQQNATSKMELERAQINYDSYVQQLAANAAGLIETQWALQQKTSTAPVTGRIFDTYYRVGEKVMAYQPVVSLLAPENIHIIFFLPEEKLSQMKIEQKIGFSCDGCKEKKTATITYISPNAEYTPPVIYSNEARGKLVYKVRASLALEDAKKFNPGQPIEVYFEHE